MSFSSSNINEILQNIFQDNILQTNRYELIINIPQKMSTTMARSMTIRCNSVSLPGRSITTQNYRFYGPQRQMPYEPLYSGLFGASYILSGDMRERIFFENWMDSICNRNNYKFSFYDEYTTTVILNILDKTDSIVYTAEIEEVYPKEIGEISMGYDKDNEYMTQDVIFVFRKYTPKMISMSNPILSQIQNGQQAPQPQQPKQSPNPKSVPPIISPNTRSLLMPRQWFEALPGGGIQRIGKDGSVNGIIG